jgi:hypothetical protein
MAEEKWLMPFAERGAARAEAFQKFEKGQRILQEKNDRLARIDTKARRPILEAAEVFLAEYVIQINAVADDLAAFAGAPVDRPEKMTLERFGHPPNIAPRLMYREKSDSGALTYAYYYLWVINFYETAVRMCLTVSEDEKPLFVLVKDLTPDSLFRFIADNIEDIKRRLCKNIERHVYLNSIYG